MFVYLLTLLLANSCSQSFGSPIIHPKGNETSAPLSTVLEELADSCSSLPISSLIKSKVKECSVLPSFAGKKQIECVLLLDISSQLCNAVAVHQIDILPANIEKIKEPIDVEQLCTVAKTWNASILSQDPKYSGTIDKIFKSELKCAQVCGVEEITSQDSNFFCKFYKWGVEMLSAGANSTVNVPNNTQSVVAANDRIKTASDLPSEEGGADPASSGSSKDNESHLQNDVPQPPKALEPVNPNKPDDATAGALWNQEAPSSAGASGHPEMQKSDGALGTSDIQNPPGVSVQPAKQNLAEVSGQPQIQNPPVAPGNPKIQNPPVAPGNPQILNPPVAPGNPQIQNPPVAPGNPQIQNLPVASGHPQIKNLPGVSGHPQIQNLHGVSENSAIQNLPGAAGNPALNPPGASGNDVSNQAGGDVISGIASIDTSQSIVKSSQKNNNDGALDYEDQQTDDQADKDQFQNYNEDEGVNVEQTPSRLSMSSVSKTGVETDLLSSNKLPGFSDDDDDEDHFFSFFLTVIIMVVLLYILYHNKNKVSKVFFGLLVEGRQGRRRNSRGHAYRRLDTLEQAMSTNSAAPPSKIIY